MDLALNNLQRLICHKTKQTEPNHHPERKTIAEHFYCGKHTTTSYNTRKTNFDFCLNFCASVAHKEGERSVTNLKSE